MQVLLRMTTTGWLVLFLWAGNSLADPPGELFHRGNNLYEKGELEEALALYLRILEDYESGSLYYNIGNCYFKLGHVGKAILFYERARRLMPGDEDVQTNLALSNLKIVDKITPLPEFWLLRLMRSIVFFFSKSILTIGGLFSYFVCVAALILTLLSNRRLWRSAGAKGAVASGTLLLLFGLFLVGQLQWGGYSEAVIMVDSVEAMSGPGVEAVEVFALHEGTKVRIEQTSGQWVEILLADGNVGWVKVDALEVI
ncbi:MAG: tetratricopeptide repeat protein [Acidobacteriota bacterium]